MRWMLTVAAMVVLVLGGLILVLSQFISTQQTPPTADTAPATNATSATASSPTQAAPSGPTVVAWVDLLRRLPGLETAEVADRRFPLEHAAHIRLPHWSYICPRGDLWVSHPDAPDLAAVPDDPPRGVHISREEVVFVHWARVGRQYRPNPIYRDRTGAFHLLRRGHDLLRLQRQDYQWPFAMSLADRIVVPTEAGVAVIEVSESSAEHYAQLSDTPGATPLLELTPQGFLAWIPQRIPEPAPRIAYFADGRFAELPDAGWTDPILHLVPFVDGSVLQVIPRAGGKVQLRTVSLESAPPDLAAIRQYVELLSDEDPVEREAAHAALARMGPSAWRVLEELRAKESGESAIRIQNILRAQSRPQLGRFEIVGDALLPVWRLRDGMIFLATEGARAAGRRSDRELINPAWISVRRGQPITILPPGLVIHLALGPVELQASGGEWIISDELLGAQWFFGQELIPLTSDGDRAYRRLVGIDRSGRILLAKADAPPYAADFLLIDPAVSDPTPRVHVWTMRIEDGEVGWDDEGWPAVKRGGAYTLKADSWESLAGPLHATAPTPTTRPGAEGVLTRVPGASAHGSVWMDDTHIVVETPAGEAIRHRRPANLPPEDLAALIAGDSLYLVHPGEGLSRLRIAPNTASPRNTASPSTPDTASPLTPDARFTDGFPDITAVNRMWLDPAGRLCITTDDQRLIVLFIDQEIPPSIIDMLPADELKQIRGHP